MQHILFPPSLKKGDQIAVISPAGSVEPAQLEKGLALIEDHGFVPVLGKNVYTNYRNGYSYAGTEDERTADAVWAFNDEKIAAVWTSRGGYGCQHLLQKLHLRGFRRNPKWFIGYSDNTVLQSFLLKKGFASLHAQSIKTADFGVSEDSITGIFDILKGEKPVYKIPPGNLNRPGKAEAQLVGGNLALIYALLGTPYGFDFRDKILFIEEIGEKYYALDRMLVSLELAGVFKKIKGLIIGGMTQMGEADSNKNYEESFDDFAFKIIAERIEKYNFPVLFGFPNGHIFRNLPLIIGAPVVLKVSDQPTLRF